MNIEETKNNLDPLYEATMKEQRNINDCIEQLTQSAKDFTGKRYAAEVNNLSADGYRKLENVINIHSTRLAMEIADVIYRYNDG